MKIKSAALSAALTAIALTSCGDKQTKTMNESTDQQTAIENIMTRASVRKFTDREISRDTIETLVKAGMAAPTAMNKQPWEFVAVTDRAVLDSIEAVHPYSNLKTATAAIIVCGNMQKTIEGEGQSYWIQDCSAATENVLLAAHAMGLGAVWCGVYPIQDRVAPLKEVLGMPSYVIPLNVIALGYPEGEVHPKDKWNPEALHFNKY